MRFVDETLRVSFPPTEASDSSSESSSRRDERATFASEVALFQRK